MHRTASYNKELLVQNVNSAKVGNFCPRCFVNIGLWWWWKRGGLGFCSVQVTGNSALGHDCNRGKNEKCSDSVCVLEIE